MSEARKLATTTTDSVPRKSLLPSVLVALRRSTFYSKTGSEWLDGREKTRKAVTLLDGSQAGRAFRLLRRVVPCPPADRLSSFVVAAAWAGPGVSYLETINLGRIGRPPWGPGEGWAWMAGDLHSHSERVTAMGDLITQNEASIRLAFFFGVFGLMAIWEILAPRRELTESKPGRWVNNLSLVVVNTVVLRVVFPTAAVGVAAYAIGQQWGLFNQIDTPLGMEVVLSVVVLDGTIFLQHIMFHAVPVFWRLHRVHHADMDIDVTTGARFHTIEILLSMLIKFAAIILLGPPLAAVVAFEVILNATSMFNHSNVRLPLALDRFVRLLIVTPDMHRVHHSRYAHETNSNFGFNLSVWDRLFGTYRAQPDDGHDRMVIGIDTFRDSAQCSHLHRLLLMPFVGAVRDYAINSRKWTPEEEA